MMKENISFLEFEAVQARHERRDRRFIIALIICTAMLFISNFAWMWAFLGGCLK